MAQEQKSVSACTTKARVVQAPQKVGIRKYFPVKNADQPVAVSSFGQLQFRTLQPPTPIANAWAPRHCSQSLRTTHPRLWADIVEMLEHSSGRVLEELQAIHVPVEYSNMRKVPTDMKYKYVGPLFTHHGG